MNPTETALVIMFAGMATAIALQLLEVPPAVLHSSISQAFLLIIALVMFAYSPVVGIAAIALFAIMMFKRNVQKTAQYHDLAYELARMRAGESMNYADEEADDNQQPVYVTNNYYTTQPREYSIGLGQPSVALGQPSVASAQPSSSDSFADFSASYANPDSVGSYPLGDARPRASASKSFTAMYRPTPDMGDNTFNRDGPNIDEKGHSFQY